VGPPEAGGGDEGATCGAVGAEILKHVSKEFLWRALNAFLCLMENRVGMVSLGVGAPVLKLIADLRDGATMTIINEQGGDDSMKAEGSA
jgi:hypothetical protein